MGNLKVTNLFGYEGIMDMIRSLYDQCFRTERQLSAFVDGELSSKDLAKVSSHVAQCKSCREAVLFLETTHAVLLQRVAAQPPAYLTERLKQAIALEAARPQLSKPIISTRLYGQRLAIAGAIAATMLVAVTVLDINRAPEHLIRTKFSSQTNHQPIAINSAPSIIAESGHNPTASTYPNRAIASIIRNTSEGAVLPRLAVPQHSDIGLDSVKDAANVAAVSHSYREPIGEHQLIAKSLSPAMHFEVPNRESVVAEHGSAGIPSAQQLPVASVATVVPTVELPSSPVQSADEAGTPGSQVSLVDSEMQSLAAAVNSQYEQPKLVKMAISHTRLADYSPGVQIEGSEIDRSASGR